METKHVLGLFFESCNTPPLGLLWAGVARDVRKPGPRRASVSSVVGVGAVRGRRQGRGLLLLPRPWAVWTTRTFSAVDVVASWALATSLR